MTVQPASPAFCEWHTEIKHTPKWKWNNCSIDNLTSKTKTEVSQIRPLSFDYAKQFSLHQSHSTLWVVIRLVSVIVQRHKLLSDWICPFSNRHMGICANNSKGSVFVQYVAGSWYCIAPFTLYTTTDDCTVSICLHIIGVNQRPCSNKEITVECKKIKIKK